MDDSAVGADIVPAHSLVVKLLTRVFGDIFSIEFEAFTDSMEALDKVLYKYAGSAVLNQFGHRTAADG